MNANQLFSSLDFPDYKETVAALRLVQRHENKPVLRRQHRAGGIVGEVFAFLNGLKIEIARAHVKGVSGPDPVHMPQMRDFRERIGKCLQDRLVPAIHVLWLDTARCAQAVDNGCDGPAYRQGIVVLASFKGSATRITRVSADLEVISSGMMEQGAFETFQHT